MFSFLLVIRLDDRQPINPNKKKEHTFFPNIWYLM